MYLDKLNNNLPTFFASVFVLFSYFICASSYAVKPTNTADAFKDFSTTNNPNGSWSYGYRFRDDSTISGWGEFSLLNIRCDEDTRLPRWVIGCYEEPDLAKNVSGQDYINGDSVFLPATNYLHFHPGPSGEGSDLKWTAPGQGQYQITANFTSLRIVFNGYECPVSTDVHVLINGQELFGASLEGFFAEDGSDTGTTVPPKQFNTTLPLNRGDTVEFIVGDGRNWYACDSTGVSAKIVKTTGIIPPMPPRPTLPTPPICAR